MIRLFIILTSFIFAGELEVEGDLKVSGNVVFQDETSINTALSLMPTGVIMPYAGNEAPEGWILCHGQEINRIEYANLFILISEIYGPGNGSTTFNLPDLRGRMILGIDNMGGVSADRVINEQADLLGGSSGEEMHQLSVEELASHNHPISTHSAEGQEGGIQFSSSGNPGETEFSGGDQPHNNMPPYIALNYIIKY